MEILSHRGCWRKESEKNSIVAFERSFALGFGTEMDIRDYNGELVVAHDIADRKSLPLVQFFQIYNGFNKNLPLALNIKADGLQLLLKEILKKYKVANYFVFDMSIPETLSYVKGKFNFFTRQSEYELNPALYEHSSGVWLDEFHRHWITESVLLGHKKNNKRMCIVSPDLHKRDYRTEWNKYKGIQERVDNMHLMLCTDFPEKAKEFFDA